MGIRSDLETSYGFDIVEEFLDHLEVMCDDMEPQIILLLKKELRRQAVDELFRIFHNIKSASGFLQIARMKLVASLAEEELELVRSGAVDVSDELVDWLLVVSDQMRTWRKALEHDGILIDINPQIVDTPDR